MAGTPSQAFRNALHVPVADPLVDQGVQALTGGHNYTSRWAVSAFPEAPNDGNIYGRQSLGWTNVSGALALKAPLDSPVFTGDPRAPTPLPGDNDTSIATTAWVRAFSYIGEAPNDGNPYIRQSLGWVAMSPIDAGTF